MNQPRMSILRPLGEDWKGKLDLQPCPHSGRQHRECSLIEVVSGLAHKLI